MTTPPTTPLADAFDAPDEATWRDLAQAGLKGLPWERLIAHTADAIPIQPLYRAPDFDSARDAAGLPGQAPFIRGPVVVRDRYLAWDIRQSVADQDPQSANTAILTELQRGASSIEWVVRHPDQATSAAMAQTFDQVFLNLAPVSLDAGHLGLSAATALSDHLHKVGADPAQARPYFNIDPIGTWLRAGGAHAPIDAEIKAAAQFASTASRAWPQCKSLRINALMAHEAGATPAQELGVMLAAGVEMLRAMEDAGVSPGDAGRSMVSTIAVSTDIIQDLAKLRAARLVWARMMQACGAAPEARAITLHAVTAHRMMTRDDAWTNILRTTAACFAAAAGGADVITVAPFTAALGDPSALARRIARNTQIILMEESNLGRVSDPGGGAWAIERLTQEIANAAWAFFQTIEAQGGLRASARAGKLQDAIAAAHEAAMAMVARRKYAITGVSDFPLLNEIRADFTVMAPALNEPTSCDPIRALAPSRLAKPFEDLRDAASGAAFVFCATLGARADFSPRANFARNLLASGGVSMVGDDHVHADQEALIASFVGSKCQVVVLCGDDAHYKDSGEAAVRALKAAGASWLIYAGKPADEAHWRAVGCDQFIFAGQNAIDALQTLHSALGIAR